MESKTLFLLSNIPSLLKHASGPTLPCTSSLRFCSITHPCRSDQVVVEKSEATSINRWRSCSGILTPLCTPSLGAISPSPFLSFPSLSLGLLILSLLSLLLSSFSLRFTTLYPSHRLSPLTLFLSLLFPLSLLPSKVSCHFVLSCFFLFLSSGHQRRSNI